MKKLVYSTLCALTLTLFASGCYTLVHDVGKGAQSDASAEERQWYALWGLVPLGKVESHDIAGGATDYTVKTEQNVIDVLMNLFTAWVTIYSRTVTVTR